VWARYNADHDWPRGPELDGAVQMLTLAQPAQDPLMVTIPPFGAESVPLREPDLPPTDVVAVPDLPSWSAGIVSDTPA
jgi:hypothetical protein